ncbi:hypothetical protein [Actinomadura viridis]|uniref:Zn finger protein n=1 Tax=Actinomadura viridis TaxID=58110 RepID=A0A931GRP5_9ACTN|nr:hypothetical protein [Actinomadura viridis]MBG6089944.1 putative Zn finger protein [Actinomadura viridis]
MSGTGAYADCCPECLAGPFEPYETDIRGESLVGAYRCQECGHVWPCWWNIAALPEDASSAGDVA